MDGAQRSAPALWLAVDGPGDQLIAAVATDEAEARIGRFTMTVSRFKSDIFHMPSCVPDWLLVCRGSCPLGRITRFESSRPPPSQVGFTACHVLPACHLLLLTCA